MNIRLLIVRRLTSLSNTRLYLLIAVMVAAFSLIACGPPLPPAVADGDAAPEFEATEINGRSIRFPAAANNKPSVVLLWATWCPYCKVLMPRLNEIRAEYYEEGVQIVAINAKERGRGDPAKFIRESGYDFITIAGGDDIAQLYDVEYLPGLFVVNGNGTIVYRRKWTELPAGVEVADLWEQQIRVSLDRILGEPVASID